MTEDLQARNPVSKLGLNGWTRNHYDGRVEAVFERRSELIEQAIQGCWKGPDGSSVRNIEIQWEESSGEF